MKKNNTTKSITYFIGYVITFNIADNVTNFWGISHKKILSLDFALYIIIAIIVFFTFEFLVSKIMDKWSKRKNSNK